MPTDNTQKSPFDQNYPAFVPYVPQSGAIKTPVGSTPQTNAQTPATQDFQGQLDALKQEAMTLKNYLTSSASNAGQEISSSDAISAQNKMENFPGSATGGIPSGATDAQSTEIQSLLNALGSEAANFESQTPQPLSSLYSQLYSQPDFTGTSLQQYEQQIAQLKNAELGMPLQVAGQVEKAGGIAPQSLIDAMAQRNNAVIDMKIQSLGNLAQLQQNYVNKLVTLTGEDQQRAEQRASRLFNMSDALARLLNTMSNQDFRKQILLSNLQNSQERLANQTQSAQILDALRQTQLQLAGQRLEAAQGGQGSGSSITYAMAQKMGLPLVFIGQKTGSLTLNSNVPPQWFVANEENKAQATITPSEIASRWDNFRFSVPSAPTKATLSQAKITQLTDNLGVPSDTVLWIAEQKGAGTSNQDIIDELTNEGYTNAADMINAYDSLVGQGIPLKVESKK